MLISDCLLRVYLPNGNETDVTEDMAAVNHDEQLLGLQTVASSTTIDLIKLTDANDEQ